MTNYIFTELNNGDILFAALENGMHGKVVAIVAGWERQKPGTLADALRQLAEDPTAYEDWDGQIEIPESLQHDIYPLLIEEELGNTIVSCDQDGNVEITRDAVRYLSTI